MYHADNGNANRFPKKIKNKKTAEPRPAFRARGRPGRIGMEYEAAR